MKVNKQKFETLFRKLLEQPPSKRESLKTGEKKKAEDQAIEEKKRLEWIKSQPWSPAVKAAAIKKQPTPGLNGAEVKRVLGAPTRVSKIRGTAKVAHEERWFYADGSVLTFHNGLLSSVEKRENK